ncbi:MAG: hypothetical protein GAK30_02120 [Paracidovorax wautersii]|uniref:Tripartite-type tricarboxylate transporter, receptor component TctC n=1 Tax=Paracidovorax wautersii TaxID=1177982 RepID=A0A7V8FNP2_9BURK|nr:MAG: hypothetical protein GAK30_02120 [Paracidovorax wautersii]
MNDSCTPRPTAASGWRRRDVLLSTLAGLAAGSAHAVSAPAATAYPQRLISIVVPTAAGGGNDAIASEYVARAKPDGYTVLFGYIGTHGMNPALQRLRYDPIKSFEPIGMVCTSPTLMVAAPQVKARTVAELVQQSKASPQSFNYASAGNGTAPHFAAEMFKLASGAQLTHVPYKGSAPAMTDTMAGQTQIMFPSLFSAYPYVHAGKLRALAVAGPQRSRQMPDVPTLGELGYQNVDVTQWYAMFAPAGTPADVVARLNQALNQALADPAVAKRIETHGADVVTGTPDQLRTLVSSELDKWRRVVAQAGLSAD